MSDTRGIRGTPCLACGLSRQAPLIWLAGSARRAAETDAGDYDISKARLGRGLRVLACPSCGFAWLDDRQETVTEYDYGRQDAYLYEERNRLRTARKVLSMLPDPTRNGSRLLDIGASVGYFTKAARELGYDATGIEPSAWAVQYGRERLAVDMIQKSAFDMDMEANSADVVLMMDFIEHTTAFHSVLDRVTAWLKPGGLALVSTPDIGSPAARLLRGRWWSLKPEHVVYFTRPSLCAVMAAHGLETVTMTTYPRAFSLPYIGYLLTGSQAMLGLRPLRAIRVPFNFHDQMLGLFKKA